MKVCKACGKQNNNENNFCCNCAAPLPLAPPLTTPQSGKHNVPFYKQAWFWILAAVVLAGALYRLYYAPNNYSDNAASQQSYSYASPSPSTNLTNQIGEGHLGPYYVKILGYELTYDYNDKPTIIVSLEWTNNSKETTNFMSAFTDEAFQYGIECGTALVLSDDNYDSGKWLTDIKPGVTIQVKTAYVLQDFEGPVEIELTKYSGYGNDPYMVKQTFNIVEQ